MSSITYQTLPNELWLLIFTKLKPKDIDLCRRVCRLWNAIASDECLWKKLATEKFPRKKKYYHELWIEAYRRLKFIDLLSSRRGYYYYSSKDAKNSVLAMQQFDMNFKKVLRSWTIEFKTKVKKQARNVCYDIAPIVGGYTVGTIIGNYGIKGWIYKNSSFNEHALLLIISGLAIIIFTFFYHCFRWR